MPLTEIFQDISRGTLGEISGWISGSISGKKKSSMNSWRNARRNSEKKTTKFRRKNFEQFGEVGVIGKPLQKLLDTSLKSFLKPGCCSLRNLKINFWFSEENIWTDYHRNLQSNSWRKSSRHSWRHTSRNCCTNGNRNSWKKRNKR